MLLCVWCAVAEAPTHGYCTLWLVTHPLKKVTSTRRVRGLRRADSGSTIYHLSIWCGTVDSVVPPLMWHDALFPASKTNCGRHPRGDDILAAIRTAPPPPRLVRARFSPTLWMLKSAFFLLVVANLVGSSEGSPLTDGRDSAPVRGAQQQQQKRSTGRATVYVPLGRTADNILEALGGEAIKKNRDR